MTGEGDDSASDRSGGGERPGRPVRRRPKVPRTATRAETAAILAAVGEYLRGIDAQIEDRTVTWQGERWAFAGRLEGVGSQAVRVPESIPEDRWTAAGRLDHLSRSR